MTLGSTFETMLLLMTNVFRIIIYIMLAPNADICASYIIDFYAIRTTHSNKKILL